MGMMRTLILNGSYIFVVRTILHSPNGWKKNQTYFFPEVYNEMCKDMSLSLIRDVALEAIKSSDYHKIMVY